MNPVPGELKLAKAFWPVLPDYARNLLVGTDVAERRDDEGGLVVAGLALREGNAVCSGRTSA